MRKLLDLLVANGLRRGRAGNTAWLVVGAAAWMLRRARSHRMPEPVYTEDLEPGESLLITHLEPGR